jgi:hypothetical protein
VPKTLTPEEEALRKEMLKIVLKAAGTDESKLRVAIMAALRAKGEFRQGYRTSMLWRELEKKALPKIRKAKKDADARQPSLV